MPAEIRKLIWQHCAVAVLALSVLLVAFFWWHEKPALWPFPPERPELTAKINEIQDLEHLRKVALVLVKGSNDLARNANKVFDSAVRAILALLALISFMGLVSALSLLKHVRRSAGRPIAWLNWL